MTHQIKIEFANYVDGQTPTWEDWSEYLVNAPNISKKVESENEGEAGVIVFDNANVTFRYEYGNPVYAVFSIDLSTKQRYLFRIYKANSAGQYVQLFEGMADFSTIEWDGNSPVISFDIVDKLSAIGLLQSLPARTAKSLKTENPPWLTPLNWSAGHYYKINIGNNPEVVIEVLKNEGSGEVHVDVGNVTPVFEAGEILMTYDTTNGTKKYLFAQERYFYPGNYPPQNDTWLYSTNDSDNLVGSYRIDSSDGDAYKIDTPSIKLKYFNDIFYIGEICDKITSTHNGIPSVKVTSFQGLKILELLIKQAWSNISIIKKGITAYNIPYNYWRQTIDEKPFQKEPIEALKMLADTMGCYVYIDISGNAIIQIKGQNGLTKSIGTTVIINKTKKYFWDKLVDGANVEIKSWIVDAATGQNLIGKALVTKQTIGFTTVNGIKPRNELKKELLTADGSITTQEGLNTSAANYAINLMNFYGLRRSSYKITFNLDDNILNNQWELVDNLIMDGNNYFFTGIQYNLSSNVVDLEMVETQGHDYDPRALVFSLSEANSLNITSNPSADTASPSVGYNYIFNTPLSLLGSTVSLDFTNNLKLTTNKLDTAQPIKTTDTPTFAQVNLSNAGTSTQAVRGDRNIATSAPLTGGGDLTANRTLALSYNATNLKLTLNALDTIQDIATTSTPTFAQVNLSSAGTSTQAVRGDRSIATSAPLTGGGDLTANRTLALSYNTTNLKLTSNALDTIQNISSTSSPTFAGLYINGSIFQSTSSLIQNNFLPGWTGTGWRIDYGVTNASFSNLEIDNLTVRKSMKVFEFIINQIRATNGSLFVSSSAKVASATLTTGTTEYYSITFDDPEGYNICPFAIDDILLIQRVRLDSTTLVKRIVLQVTSVSYTTISTTVLYRDGLIDKNDVCVRIGNVSNTSRQGNIYLTSDDVNAPYIDIADNVNSWTAWQSLNKLKLRLGKLDGITDSFFGNLNGYGLYAKSNVYLRGKIYAENGGYIGGWNISNNSLTSPYIYSGITSQMELISDSALSKIGLYLNYDINNDDRIINLSFGRIIDGYGGLTSSYGFSFRSLGDNYFEISNTLKQIAGWEFDSSKLIKGTPTLGIALNTSSTPFISGASAKGFEVYDYTNPKLFIGKKDGNSLDWNITEPDTLTIKGTIKSSRFSTTNVFAGAYNYLVIDADNNGYFLKAQRYVDLNNNMHVLIQPNGTTDLMSLYNIANGVAQTINFNYYNGQLGISINGAYAIRWRGNLVSDPNSDLRYGDIYFNTYNARVYIYTSNSWVALN
ncbi:MAG: hypothetical protein ACOYWZ_07385 [Bacillota bacterium]